MTQDIRWQQRFQNFDRAVVLLREALEIPADTMSNLEKEGMIQRFEFVLELAWKTVKDFLEYQGIQITPPISPRSVIKDAFAAQIIADGQIWIDMIEHRNLLSHTYKQRTFDEAAEAIRKRYHAAIEDLHLYLMGQRK
jgi:nucleotidyltransferase substrate binding protein (TIGR01987 family)